MGVEGAFPFLTRNKISSKYFQRPLLEEATHYHVDLLGAHYRWIQSAFLFNEENTAAMIVMEKLGKVYNKTCTTLYLDGGRTEEKRKTAKLRRAQRSTAVRKLQQLLVRAEQDAGLGNKMSKTAIENIQKKLRKSFELQSDMKKQLLEAARAAGWNFVDCIGESDLAIARLPLTEKDVVISSDSDFLFHDNVQHLFRPTHSKYRYYCKRNILDHLGVTSVQWTSVGIVSGNDYDKAIPGYGIKSNFDSIRKINLSTVKDIITQYLYDVDAPITINFKNAIRIFVHHEEALADTVLEKSAAIDYADLRQRMEKIGIITGKTRRALEKSRKSPQKSVERDEFMELDVFKKIIHLEEGHTMYREKPYTELVESRKRRKTKAAPSKRSKSTLKNENAKEKDNESV